MIKNYIYQGHLVCKRLGQHFLHDSSIINSILAAMHPKADQVMVEIGPGLGAMTKPVALLAEHLIVIEIDRHLAAYLAKQPCLQQSRLHIMQQDAMTVDFSSLANKLGQPLRIFGNLPYNISTPLIFYLCNYIDVIRDMHFLLQKEVVNRLVAIPNNKDYGRLSVMAQYSCHIIKVLEVPPSSFKPVPKVDSALVRLEPYSKLPYPVRDLPKLATLTNLAFNQRRKKLSNSLSKFFSAQQLVELGIDAKLRAENVSIEQYCRLANALVERERELLCEI